MTALGGNQTQFEVTPETQGVKPFTITSRKHINEEHLQYVQTLLISCKHAEHLLNLAGTSVEDLTLADLEKAVLDLYAAYMVMTHNSEGITSFKIPITNQILPSPANFLYVNAVTLGNTSLAYGAVVTMTAMPEADYLIWHPTAVSKPRVSRIADKQAYRDFIEKLKDATGMKNLAIREIAWEDAALKDPSVGPE